MPWKGMDMSFPVNDINLYAAFYEASLLGQGKNPLLCTIMMQPFHALVQYVCTH